jgi:transcriptional regulator with XRE-family HTH domain
MITKNIDMTDFRPAKKYIDVSPGESVRIVREMQELTLERLATMAGVPEATLSAIENDLLALDMETATALATALQVVPAVLMSTGNDVNTKSAA